MADLIVFAPRDAGIAAVAGLKQDLLAALDNAGSDDVVILDLGKVTSADSALAQLVISFKHEARKRKKQIAIDGEDSKNSVSALLGCDVVCEACTFNVFKDKTGLIPVEDIQRSNTSTQGTSKTKRSRS